GVLAGPFREFSINWPARTPALPGLCKRYSPVSVAPASRTLPMLGSSINVPASRSVSDFSQLRYSELRLELAVTGARVEQAAYGAQLVLQNCGRKIAYSRLKVTDANGKELPARIEVSPKPEIRNPKSEMSLAVVVDDSEAVYPIRIDPTFSDANWISLGGLNGAGSAVYASVADGLGNMY